MIELTEKNIKFINKSTIKEEALRNFGEMALNVGCIDNKDLFYRGLIEREKEFSTGIGFKIAIPHCKSIAVKKASVFIQKFSEGVKWGGIDDDDVIEVAICLAVPEEEGTTHLKLLSKIARSLMNKEFTKKLLSITTTEEMLKEITSIINND